MTERLSQVNRMLDRACKKAGMDPVDVRLAMVQTINAKLAEPAKVICRPEQYDDAVKVLEAAHD